MQLGAAMEEERLYVRVRVPDEAPVQTAEKDALGQFLVFQTPTCEGRWVCPVLQSGWCLPA
jgi:hypothetical protein